ncbi:class A beta-lactamase [Pseudomonas cremoricolorata]|uniref:class A beta-lactamase n=1 Tax=Pseudomonas cremoricolorata TaxID=157783 RepID=UPI0003F57C85
MKADISRRRVLQGAAAGSTLLALPGWAADSAASRFEQIERQHGITLGVFALDTGSGRQLGYRAEQRLPMCSTFKVMLAGAVLQRSQAEPQLLARVIRYPASALVVYSLVTERHVEQGMSVAELCAAALQYSDNTAANLLLELLGGPAELTAFARRVGDPVFRLDRIEPDLNSALPDDPRDTSSAQAMALSLQRLALGDALDHAGRGQLQTWLKGNTTGAKRIRAGVPVGWTVGDKTGSGDYGVANDVALLWPAGRAPWVLAVLSRSAEAKAAWRDAALAEATGVVVAALG